MATLSHSIGVYSDGSLKSESLLPVRPHGILAFVLFDWQTQYYYREDWGYSVPRSLFSDKDGLDNTKGYPGMCPLDPRVGVKLTEKLQLFWVDQMSISLYQKRFSNLNEEQTKVIKQAWLGMTKSQTAFTNNAGTEEESGRRNYINGWNLDGEYPILFENVCIGTTVELYNNYKYSSGYKIKTLRTSDYEIWKNWTFLDHPTYFTVATNSTVIPFNGRWKVEPFHYLRGRDVPVPIISETGYSFISPSRVRILRDNEYPPSSYYGYNQ